MSITAFNSKKITWLFILVSLISFYFLMSLTVLGRIQFQTLTFSWFNSFVNAEVIDVTIQGMREFEPTGHLFILIGTVVFTVASCIWYATTSFRFGDYTARVLFIVVPILISLIVGAIGFVVASFLAYGQIIFSLYFLDPLLFAVLAAIVTYGILTAN